MPLGHPALGSTAAERPLSELDRGAHMPRLRATCFRRRRALRRARLLLPRARAHPRSARVRRAASGA